MDIVRFAVIDAATGLLLGVARGLREARRMSSGSEVDLFSVDPIAAKKIERGDIRPLRFADRLGRFGAAASAAWLKASVRL